MTCQVIGDKRRLCDAQRMYIIRIFQELVGDNRKEIDTKLYTKKSRGFADIEYRVGYLNGVFDTTTIQRSCISINFEVTA